MSKGDIKESDWKVFKPLRELALERFSERVLDEIARISSDNSKSKHERYVAIYRLVRERDKEITPIFDFQRRSTALRQVLAFLSEGLMTDEARVQPGICEDGRRHSGHQQSGAGRRGRG
jgi:hypothetical protein